MNLLTSNLQCIECGCTDLIKDYSRMEIYCSKCGLILVDTTIPSLTDIEFLAEDADDNAPGKDDYYILRRFLYNFNPMVNASIWQKKR